MIAAARYVLSHVVLTIYCAMRIIIAAALGERFRPAARSTRCRDFMEGACSRSTRSRLR